jgi:hypothetical protein
MNKTTILLFSVLSLIVIALGLTFYDFGSNDNSSNITFRKKNVIIANGMSSSQPSSEFAKLNFNQTSSSRKIKVRKYHVKTDLQAANTNSSYVSGDLSMMSNSAPRISLNGNASAGYRRYVSDNSASQMITGVASPHALRINVSSSHSHNHVDAGVVQTGPMMGAVMNHDHIFDPLNPDKCGQDGCDAIPTFPNGWGDGIFEGDTEIEWVPVGDVAYPMLLLAAIYMFFIAIRKRSI